MAAASTTLPGFMRIEGVFDLPEGFIDRIAEHFPVPLAASQTVAVLAAQSAAKLQHQIGDVRGDPPHALHVDRILEIEKWTDVNAANASMTVKSAVGVMPSQQITKTADELRKTSRRNGRVFDKSDRLAIAGNSQEQWNGGLAQIPERVAQSRFESRE